MKPTTIPIRTASPVIRPAVAVPARTTEPPVWRWRHLLRAPHRVGFFAASVVMGWSALWWALEMCWRQWGSAPLMHAVPVTWVHAIVMALGFLPLFFVGFLFTAGPKWLQQPDVPAQAVVKPVVACVVGWFITVAGSYLHAGLMSVGLGAVALAWGALTWRFGRIVQSSRVADRLHAKVIAVACAIGVVVLMAAAACVMAGRPDALRPLAYLGLWWFVVPVYVTVAHRMIPFFTASALPVLDSWRPYWLLWTLLVVSIWQGAWVGLDTMGFATGGRLVAARIGVTALGSLGVLALAIRWGLVQSLKIRLLAMLHLGFVWLGLAWGLEAASLVMQWAGHGGLGLAPLHALTMGFLGSILLAMATRVSCGHGGRTLAADNLAWALYGVLQVAVVVRVLGAIWPGSGGWTLPTAALLWLAAVGGWALRYGRWFGRPRVDGKPG